MQTSPLRRMLSAWAKQASEAAAKWEATPVSLAVLKFLLLLLITKQLRICHSQLILNYYFAAYSSGNRDVLCSLSLVEQCKSNIALMKDMII